MSQTSPLAPDPDDLADQPAPVATPDEPSLPAALGAELFGTFFLVLSGVGVALYAALGSIGGGPLAVALAFGGALTAGLIAVGRVSGGHFNPAVTLGACLAGRAPWSRLLPYWLAQVIGGALGALVLFLTVPPTLHKAATGSAGSVRDYFSRVSNGFDTAHAYHSPLGTAGQVKSSMLTALLLEAIVTAVFVGVVLAATHRRANPAQAPFAIGITLGVLLLVATPLTNGALNPARALATAIFSSSWALSQVWVFWVGPLVGAAIAGLVARLIAGARLVPVPVDDLDGPDEDDDVVVMTKG